MIEGWKHLKFWKGKGWRNVETFLGMRARSKASILPHPSLIFKALELTPYKDVKVVLIGQDPYPTKGYAHGLAFSVPATVKPYPPSLRNILTEYEDDLKFPAPRSGDLTTWAKNGILLLNTSLTVEEGKPASHKDCGWGLLTYEILSRLSHERDGIGFMLWGREAQKFTGLIDQRKHYVQHRVHPSPLAQMHRNAQQFIGSKPFSDINEALGLDKNIWRLY